MGDSVKKFTLLESSFAICVWFAFNITTVIGNKYLYSYYDFKFPFTLTLVHMAVCSVLGFVVLRVIRIHPFTSISSDEYFKSILPLACIFIVNIILGNVSLRYIPVSFSQTVKSSVPLFTVAMEVVMGRKVDLPTFFSLFPIVIGVAMVTFSKFDFDAGFYLGFGCIVLASVTTALQTIVSGLLMKRRLDSVNLIFYMAPLSFLLTLPLVLVFEFEKLVVTFPDGMDSSLVMALIGSGATAFCLNFGTFFAISRVSSLTFTVLGGAKVILVVYLSLLFFKDNMTLLNHCGTFIAIAGVSTYGLIQNKKKQLAAAKASKSK